MNRTLPQAIGQAEKALTALLFQRGIGDAPIQTNTEWVTLNQIRHADTPRERQAFAQHVARVMSTNERDINEALDALAARGIVSAGERIAFTAEGARQHEAASRRVEQITAALERNITENDRAQLIATLDAIRARAMSLIESDADATAGTPATSPGTNEPRRTP